MEYNILKVIDGISRKIYEIFGDNYNIYTNKISQNFDKPAFFIKLINGHEKHFRGNRYKNDKSFIIYGFAEDDDEEKLYEMGEKLYNLEYIELEDGSLLRGINKNYRVEDGTLLFLVDYNIFTYKEKTEEDSMKKIQINGEVKQNG